MDKIHPDPVFTVTVLPDAGREDAPTYEVRVSAGLLMDMAAGAMARWAKNSEYYKSQESFLRLLAGAELYRDELLKKTLAGHTEALASCQSERQSPPQRRRSGWRSSAYRPGRHPHAPSPLAQRGHGSRRRGAPSRW